MNIETISITEIRVYDKNAKIHTDTQIDQIMKSIEEFGFNDPIAIDENNVIIEGHGRYYAAQKLGLQELPCIKLLHLTEDQKKAYILAHNKLTMNTGFDFDMLQEELKNIDGIDMTDFGFEIEVTSNFTLEENEEKLEEILNEEKNEFNVKKGDVFLLGGKHRVMCGDSTNVEDVRKLTNSEKMNLLITDPPIQHRLYRKVKRRFKNSKRRNG